MDWKKNAVIALDVVLGIYLLLAMTAFNEPDERLNVCNDVRIDIKDDSAEGFLTDGDVSQLLRNARLSLVSQPMKYINTRQVEEVLEGNDLIDNAECYKSLNGLLCINIT